MTALPSVATWEAAETVCRDEPALRPGVGRLCGLLGIDPAGLTRFPAGSRPVYRSGDAVLKLFPPADLTACQVEAEVLGAIDGRLPAATPHVRSSGRHDGWGYVLMSYVPGAPLDAVWSRVSAGERERITGDLGELLAALHAMAPPVIPGWEPGDWASFVASRRAACEAEQRGLGLAAPWAEQIPGFLDGVTLESGTPVLLHTEIMAQHLLVTKEGGGRWRLSGLIDFEPAMRGAREYEFAAAGVFVTQGSRRLLLQLLRGYGYAQPDLGPELSRRLLAWLLLHRYCSLAAYLRQLPAPAHPTLEALAERWFGT